MTNIRVKNVGNYIYIYIFLTYSIFLLLDKIKKQFLRSNNLTFKVRYLKSNITIQLVVKSFIYKVYSHFFLTTVKSHIVFKNISINCNVMNL